MPVTDIILHNLNVLGMLKQALDIMRRIEIKAWVNSALNFMLWRQLANVHAK